MEFDKPDVDVYTPNPPALRGQIPNKSGHNKEYNYECAETAR